MSGINFCSFLANDHNVVNVYQFASEPARRHETAQKTAENKPRPREEAVFVCAPNCKPIPSQEVKLTDMTSKPVMQNKCCGSSTIAKPPERRDAIASTGNGYTHHRATRQEETRQWCHLRHSLYANIVVFCVIIGAVPMGLGLYWELMTTATRWPHLIYQLVYVFAAAVGATVTSFMLPFMGRRGPLVYSVVPIIPALIIAALLQGDHVADIFARILAGFAAGGYFTAALTFLGEVCTPRCRGRCISLVALAYWLGAALHYILFRISPLAVLAMLAFSAVFMIMCCIFLPESPYYVMQIEARDNAAEVLYFLRCGCDTRKRHETSSVTRYVFRYERSFYAYAKRWNVLDRVLMLTLVNFFVHFSGVFLYVALFKHRRGYDGWILITDSYLSYTNACMVGAFVIVALIGFAFFYILVDSMRRNCLLSLSFIGTLIANGCVLVITLMDMPSLYLVSAIIVGYFFALFAAQAEMPFVLAAEVFPHNLKHSCVAFAVTGYFAMMAMANFAARMLIYTGGLFFAAVFFIVCNVLAVVFAQVAVPSMTRFSLEEMQDFFDGPHHHH